MGNQQFSLMLFSFLAGVSFMSTVRLVMFILAHAVQFCLLGAFLLAAYSYQQGNLRLDSSVLSPLNGVAQAISQKSLQFGSNFLESLISKQGLGLDKIKLAIGEGKEDQNS